MNIVDVHSFLEIVKKKNMSKAAEGLFLTQPALSQRIRSLEDELGYALFVRKKGCRGIKLTAAGEDFLEIANQMIKLWNKALTIENTGSKQSLTLSIIDSVATCTLPSLTRTFIQKNPDIRISTLSYHSKEAYKHVEHGDVDFAITGKYLPASTLTIIPIYSEPWVFICGKEARYPQIIHPSILTTKKQLMLCNREADDWQEYWFSSGDDSPMGVDKISYMDSNLFDNNLWAVLPRSVANLLEKTAGGIIHPLQDGPAPRIVYGIKKTKNNSEAITRFIKYIYQEVEQLPYLKSLHEQAKLLIAKSPNA